MEYNQIQILSKRHRNASCVGPRAYVGRPSKFGNPFIVGKHGEQGECVALFDEWIHMPENRVLRAEMRSELKGKHLICWCDPLPCHASIIKYIANQDDDFACEFEDALDRWGEEGMEGPYGQLSSNEYKLRVKLLTILDPTGEIYGWLD